MNRIAIVGMACRYPDAASPQELWDNVLAGRRAFRQLPDERMRLEDYWAAEPAAPDHFYARHAAVLEGYEFDRVEYRIAGSTYRSTDLTHWLALDIAAQALADAGFSAGDGLPRERTGVVVGNTLTGEFSRASQLRLRWPFVRRTVAAALTEQGWDADRLAGFLADLENRYKDPFPEVDEDTLAGGLSNTIAGRICNYFDLKGGGYTVDGACSSSLLSVATASAALVEGELDVAIAGGVDLSIDPFEIVGFAKTGALARGEMRVYDRGSNGFWPGEGCGMVVLMREADAHAGSHRTYATVAGWGVSSDGRGGITRPEVNGYQLALDRAYQRAGFGVDTVALFEGHGTGTEVGDATELRALSSARRAADPAAPAGIGSIKANIGHTKAAAGVAGLIKATMAVHHRVLPPTTGCVDPHPELTGEVPALRVLREAEPWLDGAVARAGVTAMGFGGINTHVVLEGPAAAPEQTVASPVIQDAELLLLDAESPAALRTRLSELVALVPRLSYAELTDLAAMLHGELAGRPWRAAAVVSSPTQGHDQLVRLLDAIDRGELIDPAGVFLGHASEPPRVGFLFPGQGSGRRSSGGALRRRFAAADQVYRRAALPAGGRLEATEMAQPRIVTGSVAALSVLPALGVEGAVALGHSLGEITALHWAGAMDEATLLRTARERGKVMADHSRPGVMARVSAPPKTVEPLLAGRPAEEPVVIAGYNGPEQTVISGTSSAVQRVGRAAAAAGLDWGLLQVSHAFHSPLVAPSADVFGTWLATQPLHSLTGRVVSTVAGAVLPTDADLVELLRRQITHPVLFAPALSAMATEVDLLVEVGPGTVLTGLAGQVTEVPAVAIDTDDESLVSLLAVLGAAHVRGAAVAYDPLWAGRVVRALPAEHKFLANPCEAAPRLALPAVSADTAAPAEAAPIARGTDSLELLCVLAAERAELPPESVSADSRPLDDLHLSSISVGQVMNQVTRELGLPPQQAPANLATATLRELAAALDELAATAQPSDVAAPAVAGVASWVRPFTVELVEAGSPGQIAGEPDGDWRVFCPEGHPYAETLRRALERSGVGTGVLVCLPAGCEEAHVALALGAAQAAVSGPAGGRLVLVQHGRGASGLVKTARQEGSRPRTTIVDLPPNLPTDEVVRRVVAEVAATDGFTEIRYDSDGRRLTPVLRPFSPQRPAPSGTPQPGRTSRAVDPVAAAEVTTAPLSDADVLLVTGGGKGITAECALALAVDSGARLALLGRSDPAVDAELAGNLARMRAAGVTVQYVRADVTDAVAVRAAIAEVAAELGPATAVLHGAGRNEPAALADLDMAALRRTFAPKVDGLRAVLAATDAASLRLLVTFGSIIGRAGLRGEAHYAAANEWLADLTREVAREHPKCRAICLEWSVWSGVGMGERLSVVESMLRDGIAPVTPDQGVAALQELVADPGTPPVVVVTGRAGGLDTLQFELPELPLLRFVERPLVHFPGVELVTEATLTPDTDLYLNDHNLDGNLLVPAVLGMEAMAQVAAAVRGGGQVSRLERVAFTRPIVVPPEGETTVRVAALVTGTDRVEVAIRSSETDFGADHFRATIYFDGESPPGLPDEPRGEPVLLEPGRDLYGDVLFQGKQFQRLLRFRCVAARRAEVDVATGNGPWFSAFLPGDLLLGDPGMRDAFMHGIQVCVPDATLLPAEVERIWPVAARHAGGPEVSLVATERDHDGETYVYDLVVHDGAGQVVERWDGLRLQAVRRRDLRGPWAPVLLGPVLQRHLEELLGGRLEVAVEPGAQPRRKRTAAALARAAGNGVEVRYRPDGRPEVDGLAVSAAHGAGVTIAVTRPGRLGQASGPRQGLAGETGVADVLGCDVEAVTPREWSDLLGPRAGLADLLVTETGDGVDLAATRVWCAAECLQKAGLSPVTPLTLHEHRASGATVLAAGEARIATVAAYLKGVDEPVVFAVLAAPAEESR